MHRFILCVLGSAGSGKSTLIRQIISRGTLPDPVFILDTEGDFRTGLHFETFGMFWDYYRSGRPNKSGIYVLDSESDSDSDMFMRFVKARGRACTLVIDEVDKFANSYSIDPSISWIVKYGRKRGINLVIAARRPSEVAVTIRAQCTTIITFRHAEPLDLKALRDRGGDPARIAGLDKFRYEILGDTELPETLGVEVPQR